jgi:peptide/nickel transport system substrate-binding protein
MGMLRKVFIILIVMLFTSLLFGMEYKQSPMLDSLVKSGKLPPVKDRLPDNPVILKVQNEIGQYGGTLYVASDDLGSMGYGDDLHVISYETPININSDQSLSPNVIKKWEYSKDFRKVTLHIRKGIRWSDGVLFTADDILFWWKDELKNKDLVPVIIIPQFIDSTMEKIDDYTVVINFDKPYPLFDYIMSKQWGFWGKWWRAKHYLKQFNSHYIDKKVLEKRAKLEGFTTIKDYYNYYAGWSIKPINPNCPTLIPYVLKEKTPSYWIWERNPYYFKVDEAGNQLPYINRIVARKVNDLETIQQQAISGQIDLLAWTSQISNMPLYMKYKDVGNYNVYMWKTDRGTEVRFMPNLNTKKKQLHELFNNIKFRKALSLAINRDEINKLLYYNQAVPRGFYLLPSSKYYEKKWEDYYTQYNPKKANKLLDEIGLNKKNKDGIRLDKEGKAIAFTIEYWEGEPVEKTPMTELITGYWRKLGINVNAKSESRYLLFERGDGNNIDMTNWNGGGMTDSQWAVYQAPPVPDRRLSYAVLWGQWYITNGKEGEKPPPDVVKMMKMLKQFESATDPKKQLQLGKGAWDIYMKNLFVIGTVGMAPYPIIASKRLGNIPEKGVWSSDLLWLHPYHPEQFYIKHEKGE